MSWWRWGRRSSLPVGSNPPPPVGAKPSPPPGPPEICRHGTTYEACRKGCPPWRCPTGPDHSSDADRQEGGEPAGDPGPATTPLRAILSRVSILKRGEVSLVLRIGIEQQQLARTLTPGTVLVISHAHQPESIPASPAFQCLSPSTPS